MASQSKQCKYVIGNDSCAYCRAYQSALTSPIWGIDLITRLYLPAGPGFLGCQPLRWPVNTGSCHLEVVIINQLRLPGSDALLF